MKQKRIKFFCTALGLGLIIVSCAPTKESIREYVEHSKYKQVLVMPFKASDPEAGETARDVLSAQLHELGFRMLDGDYAKSLIEARTGRKGEVRWDDLADVAKSLGVWGVITGEVNKEGSQTVAATNIWAQATNSSSVPGASAPANSTMTSTNQLWSSTFTLAATPTPAFFATPTPFVVGTPTPYPTFNASASPTPYAGATPIPALNTTPTPFYTPTPTPYQAPDFFNQAAGPKIVVTYSATAHLTDVKTGAVLWNGASSHAFNNSTLDSVEQHVMEDLAKDLGAQLLQKNY